MTLSVTHSKTLIAPDSGSDDKVYGSDYVSASSHTVTGTLAATSVTGLATIATSGAITDATGTLAALHGGTGLDGSAAANGKVLIGNGSGYTLANITAGNNVSVTNGSGTIAIAASVSTASDIIFADSPCSDFDVTNGGAGGNVTILSKTVTGIVAGDQVIVDVWYSILNNSGGTRSFVPIFTLGGVVTNVAAVNALGTSATSRGSYRITAMLAVKATNLAYVQMSEFGQSGPTAAGVGAQLATNASLQTWNTTTNDLTGSQTVTLTMSSNAVTATQTLTLHSYSFRKISTV